MNPVAYLTYSHHCVNDYHQCIFLTGDSQDHLIARNAFLKSENKKILNSPELADRAAEIRSTCDSYPTYKSIW
ncbi:hypothetical protein CapIbe_023018 [Capra ibex]